MLYFRLKLCRKRRLKVLPFTVHEYEKTHEKVDLSGAYNVGINPYLCDSYVYPGERCRMRKLSLRATKFLMSLGAPTKELRIEYRKHLAEMARANPEEEARLEDIVSTAGTDMQPDCDTYAIALV